MALRTPGNAVAQDSTFRSDRTTVPEVAWTALYAGLAALLTAGGIVGAAFLATTLASGAAAAAGLLAASMAVLAVGPVAARRLVAALHGRLSRGRSRLPAAVTADGEVVTVSPDVATRDVR